MASFSITLNTPPRVDKTQKIIIQYIHNRKVNKFSLGEYFCLSSEFDKRNQLYKGKDLEKVALINGEILKYKGFFSEAVIICAKENIEPDFSNVISILKNLEKGIEYSLENSSEENIRNSDDLDILYKEYIQSKKKKVSEGTLTTITNLLPYIEKFKKYYPKPFIPKNFSYDFLSQFESFLLHEETIHGNALSNSYIHKLFKQIKTFARWLPTKGYSINPDYRDFKFELIKLDVYSLNATEFFTLYNLNLSFNPVLDEAKDLFCLQVLMGGLRFQSLQVFAAEEIDDSKKNANCSFGKE